MKKTKKTYVKWMAPGTEKAYFFTMMNEEENWSVKVSMLESNTYISLHDYIFDTDKIGSDNIHMSNKQEFREAYLKVFTILSLK